MTVQWASRRASVVLAEITTSTVALRPPRCVASATHNRHEDAEPRYAFDQIMGSLEQRIFGPLGDDVWVYPGHGDDTTLGAERPHLDEWRERGW